MRIESMHIYPVKSMRGIPVERTILTASGLLGDRRFMVVDPDGQFITQRECPALARIEALPQAGYLLLRKADEEAMVAIPSGPRMKVAVWRSIVDAAVAADGVNETLSRWIGRDAKLVFADAQAERVANPEWAGEGVPMGFADGYPVLVTTTGSLAALNRYLSEQGQPAIGMERFRPNIVIDCDEPWAEDTWSAIEIGGVRLDIVKPCERCVITTQDQMTGEHGKGDPLPAVRHLHFSIDRRAPGPIFGWNAVPRGQVELRAGEPVSVAETRAELWPFKQR
ncbi:MOSC domain-containing protein [Rhizobium sp. C1]|uniref:MOSC domain-containing protein n=1 Tax=Rhizobium sp. C1 TaxID=1349799 RepID=UPI001E53B94D|nr:MOSC domain-containing protein [Rhizobium sp. C1]MCD2177568.1 MOSC domain-containing protein [Rhizobium sp. C1]